MKTGWMKLLVGVLLVIASALIVSAQADDEAEDEPLATPTPAINLVVVPEALLRAGPDQRFVTVGSLVEGSPLVPFNISADGQWVLVLHRGGVGWIRRDLGFWVDDIDALPILEDDALTPTAPPTDDDTIIPFASATPQGNYVLAMANVLVRAGPGIGFPRLGRLSPGQTVEPVSIDESGNWVLIRYTDVSPTASAFGATIEPDFDGFGWVARPLVFWDDDIDALPIITADNLTPSPTPTETVTPTPSNTPTATLSATPSPTDEPADTVTPSPTDEPTDTATASPTDEPTDTATPSPTDEPTDTVTPSPTDTPTDTATPSPTDEPTDTVTPSPTDAPTDTVTPSPTDAPTDTVTPSPTDAPTDTVTASPTDEPTDTATASPTDAPTATVTPSPTDVPTATVTPSPTDVPTDTVTPSPTDAPIVAIVLTDTPEPTDTHTPEPSPTLTDAPTVTVTATPIDQPSLTPTPTLTVTATTTATPTDAPPALIELGGDDGGVTGRAIPPELLIGGALLALIALYAALYLRGQIAGERYAGGFVIDHCPVCQRGKLNVETRSGRLLGIPNSRHIVRCDECRSILREVGGRRWRYAVDSLEDQAMYRAYNGKVLTERQIVALDDALARPKNARRGEGSPAFVEDDTED